MKNYFKFLIDKTIILQNNEEVFIKAYASKGLATSGRITFDYHGTTKEISAVVFSESEIKRLFDGLILQPVDEKVNSKSNKPGSILQKLKEFVSTKEDPCH